MPAAAFDTRNISRRLQNSSFPKEQADCVAEVLSEVLAGIPECAAKEATGSSLALFANKIGAMDHRLGAVEQRLGSMETVQARIEVLLTKLLEGQAVLHQNDMELKRRIEQWR